MTHPAPQPWTPADPSAVTTAPRRRRRGRRALAVLLSLAVLVAVVLGAYGLLLARTFDDHRHTVDAGPLAEGDGGAVNILLLGSDSREAEGVADMGERSDTMMLVHLPADRSGAHVMSVMRDSWVEIPGHGPGKVNSAVEKGGHALVVDTVEQLLGVPVHHVVEVDFQGFRGVTEALGGVVVDNPHAFSSGQRHPSYFPRGTVLLQDTAALRYVRERHAFAGGDETRVENQQRYVAGALDRFLSPDILGNPARTQRVVATLGDHLSVDGSLTSGRIASLAWQLRGVGSSEVEMFTLARDGYGETPQGQSYVRLDETALAELRSALQADRVQDYVAAHETKEGDADAR